jgi:L-idonate 5-dehydrogenase
MRDTMLAFQIHGAKDLRAVHLPRPTPGEGEVLLAVRRAGICGSDIHYFTHGSIGRFVPKRPFVLGHEFAGAVVGLGPGVDPTLLGARVAVDPSQPCGQCKHCRKGRYNLCLDMRFFGSASCDPHIDGGFAEAVAVPARNCHRLPDTVSWGEAALLEPLSVCLHAVGRAGPLTGRSVLVTGGGTIGLLTAILARAAGAAPVVVSDPAAFARETALAVGADAALDPTDAGFAGAAAAASDGGFGVAFEASGSPRALGQAIAAVERGATLVQVGTLPAEVTLPFNDIMARELTVAGSFRFANVFEAALRLLVAGRIDVAPVISRVLPLGDMGAAMAAAVAKDRVVKVQVEA